MPSTSQVPPPAQEGATTETLSIVFVSTNTYSTPPGGFLGGAYGGEVAWYDLARSLDEMGHEVTLIATPGSWTPPRGRLLFMRSSYGTSTPWFWECEQGAWDAYHDAILKADVVSDMSHTKRIAENLHNLEGRSNCVSTLIGSTWSHPKPPYNVIVWSEAMRQMGIKGWTGYEGSPWAKQFEDARAKSGSIKDAHVVHGGTDTDFYSFQPNKGDHFLWFSRFHPSKGYHVAIDLAKRTGIKLVMMGDRPEDAPSPDHREGALQAMELARGAGNIGFLWLPTDRTRGEVKRAALQGAKALLYTIQFQECWGLVTNEALSCGTPVVATAMGAMPEIIRPGVNGCLFSTMRELEQALQDVDKIRPEDVRRDAVERLDRRVMARAYVEEYRKVMDGQVWGL